MVFDDEMDRPRRKRRTREHVIEDLSENFLERKVLLQGHWLQRPKRDYGRDVTMFHTGKLGEVENGEVRFQLKATEKLKILKKSPIISIPLETKDLRHWAGELFPFILIVFDVARDRAFWLHIQEYVRGRRGVLEESREMVNVQIPLTNKLTQKSIELFRTLSLKMVESLHDRERMQHVKKKPR